MLSTLLLNLPTCHVIQKIFSFFFKVPIHSNDAELSLYERAENSHTHLVTPNPEIIYAVRHARFRRSVILFALPPQYPKRKKKSQGSLLHSFQCKFFFSDFFSKCNPKTGAKARDLSAAGPSAPYAYTPPSVPSAYVCRILCVFSPPPLPPVELRYSWGFTPPCAFPHYIIRDHRLIIVALTIQRLFYFILSFLLSLS